MPSRKGMPKQFSVKLSVQRNQLLTIKWRAVCDVSTMHADFMVKAPGLRGVHKKGKPATLMDYNE
jgi:hypothetical protein